MNVFDFILNLAGFVIGCFLYWIFCVFVLAIPHIMSKEKLEAFKEEVNPFYFLKGVSIYDKIGNFFITIAVWLNISILLSLVIYFFHRLFSVFMKIVDFVCNILS